MSTEEHKPADRTMDVLAEQMSGLPSNLEFVPRGVRKKAGSKALVS